MILVIDESLFDDVTDQRFDLKVFTSDVSHQQFHKNIFLRSKSLILFRGTVYRKYWFDLQQLVELWLVVKCLTVFMN